MSATMDRVGAFVTRRPRGVVLAVLVVTLLAASVLYVRGVETEFTEESFLPNTDIALASQEADERFSSTFSVPIVVHAVEGGNVLSRMALLDILATEGALLRDPEVSSWLENPAAPVQNFVSVANILAQSVLAAQNVTLPTLEQQTAALEGMSEAEVRQAIVNLLTSPFTPEPLRTSFGFLLTKDFDASSSVPSAEGTVLTINLNATLSGGAGPFGGQAGTLDVERAIDRVVRDRDLTATRMVTLGSNMIGDEINRANNESLAILLPLAFIAVFIILGIVYRSVFDLAISTLALVFALVWMYGFAALAGFVLNPLTLVVPILIVGLGIDYGIHVVMRYREEAAKGSPPRVSAERSVATVGGALLLTTVTTMIAFLTNLVSPLGLLAQFGILAAVGILSTFVTMTTFVPAAKLLRESRRKRTMKSGEGPPRRGRTTGVRRLLAGGAVAAERHPGSVMVVVGVITLVALLTGLQVDRGFDFEDFLPPDLDLTREVNYVTTNFQLGGAGESSITLILVKGDISDPDLLRGLGESVDRMADDQHVVIVGQRPDVNDILALMADYATFDTSPGAFDTRFNSTFATMYASRFDASGVPLDNATSASIRELYDWLFRYAERDVGNVLARGGTGAYDATLLLVSTTATGDAELEELKQELTQDKEPLDATADSATITGGLLLFEEVTDVLEETQINSLILSIFAALFILGFVFWLAHRSWLVGLLTAVPVLLVVTWAIATMFLVGISFNVVTIVITSLTIGLGIDYAIHISHRFMEDLERYDGMDEVTRSTLGHTGLALFGAATTTVAGFGLLLFALLPPIQQFGAVTAMTIVYSLLASVFILPAILVPWARRRRPRGRTQVPKTRAS